MEARLERSLWLPDGAVSMEGARDMSCWFTYTELLQLYDVISLRSVPPLTLHWFIP